MGNVHHVFTNGLPEFDKMSEIGSKRTIGAGILLLGVGHIYYKRGRIDDREFQDWTSSSIDILCLLGLTVMTFSPSSIALSLLLVGLYS